MNRQFGKAAVVLTALLLFGQCGRVFYPEFESRSPDGRYSVAIMRNRPVQTPGYRYRVELWGNGVRRTLLRGHGPASIGLVEVNWSADGNVVRLFFCDAAESVAAGFDFHLLRTLGPGEVLPVIERQIARRYGLSQAAAVIPWACSAEGNNAYASRVRRASAASFPGP